MLSSYTSASSVYNYLFLMAIKETPIILSPHSTVYFNDVRKNSQAHSILIYDMNHHGHFIPYIKLQISDNNFL